MATFRSILAWTAMWLVTCLITTVLVLGVALSLGRLRPILVRWLMPTFGRVGLWCFGVRTELSGQEHLVGAGPRILVLNHSSVLDLFLCSLVNPRVPCPIVKEEIKWIPPLNLGFWGMGAIFIQRGDRQRAVAGLQKAAEILRKRHGTALISPEGTRSKDGRLGPFKHGPFYLSHQAGAEILPVVIRGAWALCPPGSFTVQPGVVRVEIKPPWPPSSDPPADAEALHTAYLGWLEG